MREEKPKALRLPTLPFAIFDEFGNPCEDRVRDHFAAELLRLNADIEALRKDAERYRWLFLPHTEESLSAAEQTQTIPSPTKQDDVIAHFSAWYTPKSKADSIIDEAMKGTP